MRDPKKVIVRSEDLHVAEKYEAKRKIWDKNYYSKNRDKHRKSCRDYYNSHKEYFRKYYQDHKEAFKGYNQTRKNKVKK